jgi:hypothetical protein
MKKKKLNDRMKKGELYVVYSGLAEDCSYMRLLCYGDPDRTPRIYGKGAVDGRLLDSMPICRSMATATTVLKGRSHSVLLPLSEMINVWGGWRVKRWAGEQRDVTPEEVRSYVERFMAARQAA